MCSTPTAVANESGTAVDVINLVIGGGAWQKTIVLLSNVAGTSWSPKLQCSLEMLASSFRDISTRVPPVRGPDTGLIPTIVVEWKV